MSQNITDEGSYWDTGDESLLKKIDFLNATMDELAKVLNTLPINKEDTAETIAGKIEKLLKEKLQNSFNRIKRKK